MHRSLGSSEPGDALQLIHACCVLRASADLSPSQVAMVLELAHKMKASPQDYYDALPNETLLMLFEKPSLRVSLEVGMTGSAGAISYGKKETYGDTGACLSRYVAAITACVTSREQINGLTATADPRRQRARRLGPPHADPRRHVSARRVSLPARRRCVSCTTRTAQMAIPSMSERPDPPLSPLAAPFCPGKRSKRSSQLEASGWPT